MSSTEEVKHYQKPRQFNVGHGKDNYERLTTSTTTTTTTSATTVTMATMRTDAAMAMIAETTSATVAATKLSISTNDQVHVADFEETSVAGAEATVSTSYSLFSTNPNRFILDHIHSRVHYLTDKIEGRVWLDFNGDGKRSRHYETEMENEEEDNLGIGGVNVQLIDCQTDQPVTNGISNLKLTNPVTSMPLSPYGGNVVVSQTEDESAGLFSFPIDEVESGRYYMMYTAPRDYRISGNVLPLDRNEPYFNCLPSGGEGNVYLQQAKENGDFDMSGYCARSIGCFEVARMLHSHEKSNFDDYSKLQVLEDNQVLKDQMTQGYQTYMGTLSAVPFAEYFNVGLAQEEWELPTYQYADLEVTLKIPANVDLERVVPQDFEKSQVRRQLEQGLTSFWAISVASYDFTVKGVDLHSGKIESLEEEHKKTSIVEPETGESKLLRGSYIVLDLEKEDFEPTTGRRMLRGSFSSAANSLQRNANSRRKLEEQWNRVIYTLTARGHYRPPPYQQLGSILEESINSNQQGLVNSLKEVEALPEEIPVEDVYAKWQTMKETSDAPVETVNTNDEFVFVESWAFALVITLALGLVLFVIGLVGAYFYREALEAKNASEDTYEPKASMETEMSAAEYREQGEVESMNNPEIVRELESYGVSTSNVTERNNLINMLIQARFDNVYSRQDPTGVVGNRKKKKKVTFSFTTIFGSTIGSASFKASSNDSNSATSQSEPTFAQSIEANHQEHEERKEEETMKMEQLEEAIKSCESLKIGELVQMLESLGVLSEGILEKEELVRVLAEARVSGTIIDDDDEDDIDATTGVTNADQYVERCASPPAKTPSPGREGMRNISNTRFAYKPRGTLSSPKRGGKTHKEDDNTTADLAESSRPRSRSAQPRYTKQNTLLIPKPRTRSEEYTGRRRKSSRRSSRKEKPQQQQQEQKDGATRPSRKSYIRRGGPSPEDPLGERTRSRSVQPRYTKDNTPVISKPRTRSEEYTGRPRSGKSRRSSRKEGKRLQQKDRGGNPAPIVVEKPHVVVDDPDPSATTRPRSRSAQPRYGEPNKQTLQTKKPRTRSEEYSGRRPRTKRRVNFENPTLPEEQMEQITNPLSARLSRSSNEKHPADRHHRRRQRKSSPVVEKPHVIVPNPDPSASTRPRSRSAQPRYGEPTKQTMQTKPRTRSEEHPNRPRTERRVNFKNPTWYEEQITSPSSTRRRHRSKEKTPAFDGHHHHRRRERTRSGEDRNSSNGNNDEFTTAHPEIPRAIRSCPSNPFTSAWNEAEYFSRFDRSGNLINNLIDENNHHQSNGTSAEARTRPKRQSPSLKRNANNNKPQSKSYHQNKPKNNSRRLSQSTNDIIGIDLQSCYRQKKDPEVTTQRFSQSVNLHGIDCLFEDEYSCNFCSEDAPETERPRPSSDPPSDIDFGEEGLYCG